MRLRFSLSSQISETKQDFDRENSLSILIAARTTCRFYAVHHDVSLVSGFLSFTGILNIPPLGRVIRRPLTVMYGLKMYSCSSITGISPPDCHRKVAFSVKNCTVIGNKSCGCCISALKSHLKRPLVPICRAVFLIPPNYFSFLTPLNGVPSCFTSINRPVVASLLTHCSV